MRNHEHSHHEHGDNPTLDELRELLSAESWNERYGASNRVWSGRPNQRLGVVEAYEHGKTIGRAARRSYDNPDERQAALERAVLRLLKDA